MDNQNNTENNNNLNQENNSTPQASNNINPAPVNTPSPEPPKKNKDAKIALIIIGGFFVGLFLIGIVVGFLEASRDNLQSKVKELDTDSKVEELNEQTLVISEWGVKGTLSPEYLDVKYTVPSAINYGEESASFSSQTFTSIFKASNCGDDCTNDPIPFVIIRSKSVPDADVNGTKMTQSQIDQAIADKRLVVINDWYYQLPWSGPTYSSDFSCDPTSTQNRATCDALKTYESAMRNYFSTLQAE